MIGPGRARPPPDQRSRDRRDSSRRWRDALADPPPPDDGEAAPIVLFNRHCLSCHVDGIGVGGTEGPDLTDVGEKLDPGVIERRIVNPAEVQIDAAMPRSAASSRRTRFIRSRCGLGREDRTMRRPPSASAGCRCGDGYGRYAGSAERSTACHFSKDGQR